MMAGQKGIKMLKVSYKAVCNGFEILNQNRWYWEIDNDYSRKFAIIEDAAKNWECVSYESKPYVMDVLEFMLKASARIFKTGIPVYSVTGDPIADEISMIEFSR